MNKRILLPSEIARRALEKSAKVTADLVTKGRHFAAEQIAKGGITALGFHSKYVKKPTSAAFAFLGGDIVVAASVIQDAERQAAEAAESQKLNTVFAAGVAAGGMSLLPIVTEFVTDDVYEALHSLDAVTEFNKQSDLVAKAYDPDFEGVLPAELQAFQSGKAYGPLAYEFAAHAQLERQGIRCLTEDARRSFVFDPALVRELNEQHGVTPAQLRNASKHVLIFELSTKNQPSADVTRMRWDAPEIQPVAGAAPAPIYAR